MRVTWLLPAVMAMGASVGCGGGSERLLPARALLVANSPPAFVQQEGTAESLRSTATFDTPVDLAAARLTLAGNSSVLDLEHATFDLGADGSVGVAVKTLAGLQPGDHTGNYRLLVCRDDSCSSSNELSHAVAVVPMLVVRLTGGRCNSFCSYWLVATGTSVVATANVPVAWDLRTSPATPVQFEVVASTPGRWEALATGVHSVTLSSTATLTATALQQPTYRSSSTSQTFFAMPAGFY